MYKRLRIYYLYAALPFVLLLLGAAVFSGAIKSTLEFNPHPQINYAIFVVMIIGGILILLGVHRIMHEVKILEAFSTGLRDGMSSEQLLEMCKNIEADIAYVLRMVAASVGRSLSHQEQSAIEHELHSAQNRLESRHALPQFLTSLLVGLGLLGTFIGLLSALADIGKMVTAFGSLDVASADLFAVFREMVNRMQAPMSSMAIAFSASMYGLLGSIVLGFMMVASRGAVRELHSLLGSEVSQHLNLALAKMGPATLAKVVDNMSDVLNVSIDRMARELELNFSQLGASLSSLDHNIRESFEANRGGSADAQELQQLIREQTSYLARVEERLSEGTRVQVEAFDRGHSDMAVQRSDLTQLLNLNSDLIDTFRIEMGRLTGQIGIVQQALDRNSQEMTAALSKGLSVKLFDSPDALGRLPEMFAKVSSAITVSASRIELVTREISEKGLGNASGSLLNMGEATGGQVQVESINKEMAQEQIELLRRIEEKLAENHRSQDALLQTELEQMTRTRGEMARVFNEHAEAVAQFRSELQRVGRQLGLAHALMERASTGILDILNDRFAELNGNVNRQIEHLAVVGDESGRIAEDSAQNRRLLGELADRSRSAELRSLFTEVVGAIRQLASLQIDLGIKMEQMHIESTEQTREVTRAQLEALRQIAQSGIGQNNAGELNSDSPDRLL